MEVLSYRTREENRLWRRTGAIGVGTGPRYNFRVDQGIFQLIITLEVRQDFRGISKFFNRKT